MYCFKESAIRAMSEATLHERQLLFEKALPDWENRIFKVAIATFPKVDRRLMEVDDVRQELRSALWEAILAFDSSKGMSITSWIFTIINQAASLIAKLQYHKMPHSDDGHGMQLLPLGNDIVTSGDDEAEGYEVRAFDPDSVGRIEVGVEKQECIRTIRPALSEGFEQAVFDLFMEGHTGGEIVRELGLDPKRGAAARVSSVRLKIKIAYAVTNGIPLVDVSSAKNVDYLAGRMKHLLSGSKDEEEGAEELPSPSMCPQFA